MFVYQSLSENKCPFLGSYAPGYQCKEVHFPC